MKPLNHKLFLSVKPAHTAVLVALCAFGAGTAQATCTQTGNSIDCTSPATDTGTLLFNVTTSTTATAHDWVMNGAQFHLRATGADSTFTGTNVTATNGIGGNNGVIHVSTVGTGGNATLSITNSTIEQLMSGHGLAADTTSTGGNASVTATDTHITLAAAAGTGNGIVATGSGNSSITITRGSITAANNGPAVIAYTNAGNVDIKALGAGTITITGTGTDANAILGSNSSNGAITIQNEQTLSSVVAALKTIAGNGVTSVTNSGTIQTSGTDGHGIYSSSNNGAIDINNNGAIQTNGDSASGIRVNTSNAPSINVTNTSTITTTGTTSYGINVYALTSGNITLTSSGNIQTSGSANSGGIFINTSNAHINTDISGQITTTATDSPAIELISQRNAEGTASNLLYFHDGVATVGAGSDGISLWTGGSGSIGSGEVRVGANTLIDASRGLTAVQNFMPEDGLINISAGAQIIGNTAGVQAGSQRIVLNNSGNISALSDLAIENTAFPVVTQQMAISNLGIVTGYITLGDGLNTFSNAGQWNLRHFADTDSDRIRDTLAVAVSDFGTSGNNHITNSGVIALLGDNGQATTLDNTGEYVTGYAANTMAAGGTVQGQILNVQTFTNSGTIDMGPANGAVGDVLVISGGSTPGTSGGGVYVANGGQLMLDTVLNEGGSNSQSDILVVDSTRLGNAADQITVINVGGTGSLTNGNGIELVRVLDRANSAAGAFKLSGRLVSGVYEYDLYQGGVGTAAGDGNWYLRSLSTPAPRTETGVYLRNMAAASTMFMHTLHDRLGEPQYTDRYKADTNGKVSSLWVRVTGNQTDGKAANGDIDLSTDTTLVQLGGDLARWSSNGQDRWHIGVMGAYGQSDTDADPTRLKTTNSGYKRTANGKVEGYSLGAYATWYGNQDKPTGPYVDLWGTYNWFDNTVQGNTLKEESYDSTGYTLSVEGGYAFIANEGDNRQWMIEPQAQLAYNSYSADDHYERSTNTWVRNGDSDGVIARLGARLYSRSKLNDNGIQPFVEANWWYNSAKYDLAFNGQSISDDTPDSTYELKAGLQGEVAKGWQLWGHIGGRWGENSYSRYEGMIGVKHQF